MANYCVWVLYSQLMFWWLHTVHFFNVCIYPTPLNGQDVTQGPFLRGLCIYPTPLHKQDVTHGQKGDNIFTQPLCRSRMWHKVNFFKQSLTGLSSEFVFVFFSSRPVAIPRLKNPVSWENSWIHTFIKAFVLGGWKKSWSLGLKGLSTKACWVKFIAWCLKRLKRECWRNQVIFAPAAHESRFVRSPTLKWPCVKSYLVGGMDKYHP